MLINTNEENFDLKLNYLKNKLIEEKLEKKSYTDDDIVLVRSTDHLPTSGVIPAICNVPFVTPIRGIAYNAIDAFYNKMGLSWDERKEIVENNTPLSTQYRSSVHFCLNGVVASHMYGNFDKNPFVIIEPFKYHKNDKNILAVRGEDTYFENQLNLSKEAIILVDERYIDKVIDSKINEQYQVIYYQGNQREAIDMVLVKNGILPELIGSNHIIDSKTSEMIREFIRDRGYPQDKHCYSKSYKEDDQKNFLLWDLYAREFFTYLYSEIYGNINDKMKEIELLSTFFANDNDKLKILTSIIEEIGIDSYKKVVADFNNLIIEKINSGLYPTNNEILASGVLNLDIHNIKK